LKYKGENDLRWLRVEKIKKNEGKGQEGILGQIRSKAGDRRSAAGK